MNPFNYYRYSVTSDLGSNVAQKVIFPEQRQRVNANPAPETETVEEALQKVAKEVPALKRNKLKRKPKSNTLRERELRGGYIEQSKDELEEESSDDEVHHSDVQKIVDEEKEKRKELQAKLEKMAEENNRLQKKIERLEKSMKEEEEEREKEKEKGKGKEETELKKAEKKYKKEKKRRKKAEEEKAELEVKNKELEAHLEKSTTVASADSHKMKEKLRSKNEELTKLKKQLTRLYFQKEPEEQSLQLQVASSREQLEENLAVLESEKAVTQISVVAKEPEKPAAVILETPATVQTVSATVEVAKKDDTKQVVEVKQIFEVKQLVEVKQETKPEETKEPKAKVETPTKTDVKPIVVAAKEVQKVEKKDDVRKGAVKEAVLAQPTIATIHEIAVVKTQVTESKGPSSPRMNSAKSISDELAPKIVYSKNAPTLVAVDVHEKKERAKKIFESLAAAEKEEQLGKYAVPPIPARKALLIQKFERPPVPDAINPNEKPALPPIPTYVKTRNLIKAFEDKTAEYAAASVTPIPHHISGTGNRSSVRLDKLKLVSQLGLSSGNLKAELPATTATNSTTPSATATTTTPTATVQTTITPTTTTPTVTASTTTVPASSTTTAPTASVPVTTVSKSAPAAAAPVKTAKTEK